jgi:colanic acid biosynthesis glycosyl transferase WcaI
VRILLHSINYAPEVTGVGKYNGEMGEWLAKRGHEVRVVTAPPYYPTWRVGEGYPAWSYRRERVAGADVWRCPLWVPREPSGPKRLLHLASFAASSFPMMLRQVPWRPDVVMMTEPPLICVPQARLIARLSRAKTWLHILDFEVDTALHLGMLGRWRGIQRPLYKVEHLVMRGIDRISTISERMRRQIVRKRIPEGRTCLFPNWADTEFVRPLQRNDEVRREFGAGPDDVLVLYAGSMAEKEGLELVLDAAEKLQEWANIKFALVGAGATRERLEWVVKERRLGNVRFFPVQPLERLPLMLAAGDIHLVMQRREAADLVMPSKLTNIFAAGRPSIATVDPDTAVYDVLREYNCGLVTTPGSVTELVASIVALAENSETRQRLGRNARRYADAFLRKDRILSNFEKELQNLISSKRVRLEPDVDVWRAGCG